MSKWNAETSAWCTLAVMRCLSGVIVALLLLVGCSGAATSVSPVYDDPELLKERDLSLSYLNEIGELRELLAEEKNLSLSHLNTIEYFRGRGNEEIETGSDFGGTLLTSYGPCGYFILDGQRILKLEYDSSLGPWNEDSEGVSRTFKDSIRWADTGASLFDPDWDDPDASFTLRPPNTAAAVSIDTALNPFFWVNYRDTGRFIEGEGNVEAGGLAFELRTWEGITGANRMNYSGFFGPDKDCNWDWVYVEDSKEAGYEVDTVPGTGYASYLQNNSDIKVNKDGKWVFEWKDYSCPFETRYATAVYNPELHLFVSDCGTD